MKLHADTQWDAYLTIRMCEIGKWLLLLTVICGVVACGGSDAERVREVSEDAPAADSSVSAEIDVMDIEEGDCIVSGLDTGPSVESVTIVPCSDVWQYRVVTVFNVADADEYPGEQVFDDEAALNCGDDTTATLYPTVESWDLGDRGIVCLEEAPPPTTTLPPSTSTTTVLQTTSATAEKPEDGSDPMLSASEVYELVAPSIAFIETETGNR